MPRLSHLSIENYRACKNVNLPLESYTPLVGQNNAGKSTILEAIRWVLKPSALSTGDFADASLPIVVSACISGITPELLSRVPEQKHRTAIEPYCAKGQLWIRCVANGTTAKSIKHEIYDHEHYTGEGVPETWRDYPTGLSAGQTRGQGRGDPPEDLGERRTGG